MGPWLLSEAWLRASGLDTLHIAFVFLDFLGPGLNEEPGVARKSRHTRDSVPGPGSSMAHLWVDCRQTLAGVNVPHCQCGTSRRD